MTPHRPCPGLVLWSGSRRPLNPEARRRLVPAHLASPLRRQTSARFGTPCRLPSSAWLGTQAPNHLPCPIGIVAVVPVPQSALQSSSLVSGLLRGSWLSFRSSHSERLALAGRVVNFV